jgi:hypothetical protein
MGLYNFAPRFVAPILAATKRHTIRAPRRHPDARGNTIHCYTGLRRPGARLLGRWPCVAVGAIEITVRGLITVDGTRLDVLDAEFLALRDGFENLSDFLDHWKPFLPFSGAIIRWDPDSPALDTSARRRDVARDKKLEADRGHTDAK